MKDIFSKCNSNPHLDSIKQMDVYPFFTQLETKQDIVVKMNGQEVIMLGSNNYLSLTNNDEVINAGINALKTYGSGVSGSRFLNGTTILHVQLEKELANFLNKEDCIIFSSGFNANLGILSCIGNRNDVIFCDRENHASIYDGIKLGFAQLERYYHNDMDDLEERLKKYSDKDVGSLIVTDGVFSMSGELCNLPKIVELSKKYNVRIMVDDAHGFGVLGVSGRGTPEYFGLEKDVDIIMGTFSKSLASLGGYIAGPKKIMEFIRHTSRPFIFAAALPPANLACAQKALSIIKNSPKRIAHLKEMSHYLRNKLAGKNIKIGGHIDVPIIPIYSGSELRTLVLCKYLFNNGVYVNPILPPAAPANNCLIRLSLQSNITTKLIDKAVSIIIDTFSRIPQNDEDILKLFVNK
ncbi:aminotransferase class I/II-fold pyridoxal phosphate-dependent enzyme [Mycoplasmoides alvi]|uniref:aminotransferase class I/II-fold pyridoxal phosphate-dependent enzyme n=1 Tax=Mycoplasmoides alvi TaxID=78580 RepID=UPI000A734542|nr:aminotransferase class I/II-fold pyridoxal phosphate-dependent enzyme [Mycoplasmoides alvi]